MRRLGWAMRVMYDLVAFAKDSYRVARVQGDTVCRRLHLWSGSVLMILIRQS